MTRKTALIIGNSVYQDPALAQLKAPDADVRALTELLSHTDVGQFDEVVPLVNASESKTRVAIATFFARARPDDMLLLYFSGHGVLDDKGRLYLAATDTQRELPQATAISAAFVTDAMDSSSSRRQVLILDCCHSGAFARGARGAGEAKAITAATFEGTGYGRAVLTATDATQYAWEGEAVMGSAENSVFTHCVIEGLRSGAADTDQDGVITLEELYTYVYGEVVKRTPKQTPRKWSYNQEGEFVIARNPHPLTPPMIPLPDDLQRSVDDLRPWVREGALLELERLLFGGAPGLAAAAYTALQKLKDDDSRRISVTATNLMARADAARQAEAAARQAVKDQAAHAQAERERQAQAARDAARAQADRAAQAQAEQAAQAREAQAQLERDKQAQAALAEQQRLEREQREKAEREQQAQAALAEQQRLEREQQMIADREKKIQARLAERQRVEREQKARAEQAERDRLAQVERDQQAQAALAARAQPAAPPPTPTPSAANSTSPVPAVSQPSQPPPPAANASTTGGLEQLLAAPWLPVILIGLGGAVSRGVAQALFPGDSSPYLLPWLLNWLLGGAAGGFLMGLVMRRLEPNWENRHSGQLAAGWTAAWLLEFIWNQAVNQYLGDLGLGDLYRTAGVLLAGAAGAVGGYLLGMIWRRARPGLAAQTVAPLTWGWALAWGLAALVLYVVEASNGWVVGWSFGGLAGGLAGGAVTLWVAGRVRVQPALPAPLLETRRPKVARRQWVGPIVLMTLGWGLGWLFAGIYEWLKDTVISDYLPNLYYLLDAVSAAILGAIGSTFTLVALGRLARGLSWRLVALWSAAAGFSVMVPLAMHSTLAELDWSVPDLLLGTLGPVLTGGLGGWALARRWQQLHADLPNTSVWGVAGAWAAAFGLSFLLFKGFLAPTFSLGSWVWAPAGALAGLIGGLVTVKVFTRPAAPTAP